MKCLRCGEPAQLGAYCWRHGPESAEVARADEPGHPPITAGDVLAALVEPAGAAVGAVHPVRPEAWRDLARLHGALVRVVVEGADVRVYRDGASVWAGRLVAYPAALKLAAVEAGKPYPCPRCGAAVPANLAQEDPRADCPECGAALVLEWCGKLGGGRWIDQNRWTVQGVA